MKTAGGNIERYYRVHAPLYDATRWSFLFGRREAIKRALKLANPSTLTEVGCGTGYNLSHIARRAPHIAITGVDASAAMITRCERKLKGYPQEIKLINRPYDHPLFLENPQELIIFSYSLSMFGKGITEAIEAAASDLRPGGSLAAVDFHDTGKQWFREWMAFNHVTIGGTILPLLREHFSTVECHIRQAYGGLWSYFIFIGIKKI